MASSSSTPPPSGSDSPRNGTPLSDVPFSDAPANGTPNGTYTQHHTKGSNAYPAPDGIVPQSSPDASAVPDKSPQTPTSVGRSAGTNPEFEAAKRVVLLTAFLDILGFGIVIPQLGIYASQFGAQPYQIGILASTYSLMAFFFTPFWGRLSDRVGRRPVLLYSIFGTGLGYVLFALAGSLPWLFASRFIDGITGGNISVAQAYLSDITPPENRAKNFGLFGAIFGVGFAIGPMIGWGLSHLPGAWGGNLGIGALTALLSLINWAMAVRRLPETLSPAIRQENAERDAKTKRERGWLAASPLSPHGFVRALSLKGLNVVVAVSFLATASFATTQGTFTLYVIREFVRPRVQQQIKENPQAAIQQAQIHLSNPQKGPSITADEGGGGGTPGEGGKPYSPGMGGDFNPPQVQGVTPPQGLTWRNVEQTLVQPLAAKDAGLIFFAIGMTALIVMGRCIPPLKARFGEVPMIITGTVIMAVGLALVPIPPRLFPNSLTLAFIGEFPVMMLMALGNSIASPVITSLASQFAPEAERGELLGVFQSVGSLGRIVGPVIGSFLFEVFSPAAPYYVGATLMLITFAVALNLRKVALPEPSLPSVEEAAAH